MPALAVFIVSAAVLVLSGIRLARDGDVIAEGTGLGGLWVGAILVAGATSLPELVTDVSAVRQGTPGLAVGDLFGSSMANMLVLAVADLLTRHTRVLTRVAVNQLAVGTIAVVLTTIAALGVLVPGRPVLGFGWATVAIALAYAAGMRYLHRNRPEPPFRTPAELAAHRPPRAALQRAVIGFAAAGVAILLAGPYLAESAAALAEQAGISHGFAGVVLLAITTSMPEAVVTATAVRAGAYDLAVGNLLGSNCFNMAVLAALDVADGARSLLAGVSPELAAGALVAVVLTGIAMLDALDRSERAVRRIEVTPILMIAVYLVGIFLTYRPA